MYEDWVEVSLDLLEQTASISSSRENEVGLLKAFNDEETANAITQHFRVKDPLSRLSNILFVIDDTDTC